MRLLLDTHYAFWIALKRDELKPAELALLLDTDTEVFVSSVSLWELRIKWERRFVSGERKGAACPRDVFLSLSAMGVTFTGLDAHTAVSELTEPSPNSDPFDELLLAIAQEHGMRLFTRDAKLAGHPLALVPG